MLTIETKEIKMSDKLKKKIDMICKFTNTTPIISNGSIINIKGTNVAYVNPHKVKINNVIYMFFDECEDVFVENLNTKIKFKDIEVFIKNHSNI